MDTVNIKGWNVEVLDSRYMTKTRMEDLELLLDNHLYNSNTDWQKYRNVGKLWARKKNKNKK